MRLVTTTAAALLFSTALAFAQSGDSQSSANAQQSSGGSSSDTSSGSGSGSSSTGGSGTSSSSGSGNAGSSDAGSGASGSQSSSSGASGSSGGSSASPDVLVPIDNDDTPVPSLNLMVSQVEDMQIVGSDDNEVGDVADVLGGPNGEPAAITADVGGFIGIGQKTVIIMLKDVKLDMGRLRTTLTRSEIENLPDFSG